MICSSCGHDNPTASRFCNACGTSLEAHCTACGAENPLASRFCNACGASLAGSRQSSVGGAHPIHPTSTSHEPESRRDPRSYTPRHLAEKILSERDALEGERKTITALFADITGSMELIQDLDPEEARKIVDPALHIMMEAVHRYEGYVAQSTGDGIFALFGAPIAHEDHPQRAVYAALWMQEGIRKHAEDLRRLKGVNLAIRVGLNTGEVVVRSIRKDDLHADYTPVGHSTGLAARMERLATPGAIVVSEHTHKLTEGYFHFKPLGVAQVKGVSEPVPIYEVLGVGPLRTRLQVSARRGFSRFVGRRDELAQMQRVLETAAAGRGQIVAVVGEAGVGKSRLTYEFKLLARGNCLVLEAFSFSHGKTFAYLPLIELLKNYLQITAQDDERQRREKVTGKVLALDRSLEDALPYVSALLGITEPNSVLPQMDPQIRRRRTFESVKRLLVRESLNQPVLIIVEDLHWLDSETDAFLTALSESVATARLLLLVNYRPEYQHSWGSKSYYTQLRLDPLTKDAAEEMLLALLGESIGATHASPLRPLAQLVLDKTEGNPFFMEEMVQALLDQGILVRGANEAPVRLTRPVSEIHIPPTVQGILAARIDRLPADEKALLQTLAVLGREFSATLVKQVAAQPEEELYRILAHLQAAEFIFEQPAFPEPDYTFKHALTQDVAYNSLLVERRQLLHEQAAQAIEEVFHGRLEEHYGELAHHYSRSGKSAKAIEYLHQAAGQALQRSAFAEAIAHLTTAKQLLEALPDTAERTEKELILQITLGQALKGSKGSVDPEVVAAYRRARELGQRVHGTPHLLVTLGGLFGLDMARGEFRTARELAEQFFTTVRGVNEPEFLRLGHYVMAQVLSPLGEFTRAREHVEQSFTADADVRHGFYLSFGMEDPQVGSLVIASAVLWHLGFPDQALGKSRDALVFAEQLAQPLTLSFALRSATLLHLLRREAHLGREQAEAFIGLCSEHGFPFAPAEGKMLRGWALAQQGHLEDGITQMRGGLDFLRASGASLNARALGVLAEAHGRAGQAKEALLLVAEALAAVERSGEHSVEAELWRLKGELLRTVDGARIAEAEECFHTAIEIARRQSARSWELRAVTSLSRLWQQQGKKEDARRLLAEIYGWFTEGFDTADLKEAKALLAVL